MIFGTDGEGCGSPTESVVEILLRRIDGPGRKRGVERILEGWNIVTGSACDLMKLEGLKTISTKPSREVGGFIFVHPVPTSHFNFITRSFPIPYHMRRSTLTSHPHNKNRALEFLFHTFTKVTTVYHIHRDVSHLE